MTINFDRTPHENKVIQKLARRARALESTVGTTTRSVQAWEMDFTAVHANGCPLKLDAMLDADDFNFMHDAFGIARHLNRETGKLEDFFRPRFSA